MNSITLSDLGLSILLLSVSIRAIFIGIPVYKFSRLFSGHLREGTSLFRRLEIEGLEKFVKQELFLGISPYFALCIAIWLTQMSEVIVTELSNIFLIITISVLIVWQFIDFYRSYIVYLELQELNNQTKQLKQISGNLLNALQYAVHLRGSVTKTAIHLGKRTAIKISKKKAQEYDETAGNRSITSRALSAIDRFFSFPERAAKYVADWLQDSIDEKLSKNFEKYASRTNLMFFAIFCWTLIPAIYLASIAHVFA